MANTIKLRRSATQGAVPTTSQIALGELGINTYDGRLFLKKSTSGNETGAGVSVVEIGAGGGGGSGTYTVSATAPGAPSAGDRWLDSDNGIEYTYINDGDSSAWVELSPPQLLAPEPKTNLDGGAPNTNFGGLVAIDAGGVS